MRHGSHFILLGGIVILFSSCGSPETSSQSAKPSSAIAADDANLHAAALWSRKKNTESWTDAVLAVVQEQISQLERARDVAEFCPAYASASIVQREACWVRLISSVSSFESGFNPRDEYRESSGNLSIGLLALSPGECPGAPSAEDLKNPLRNLACGTKIMARLIARDGWIEGPENARGAAAYWSTLRAPYVAGNLKLGKKHLIVPITNQYRAFDYYAGLY